MRCLQDDLKTLSLYQMVIDMKLRNIFRSLYVSIHSVYFVLTLNLNSRQRQLIDAAQPTIDGQAQGNV